MKNAKGGIKKINKVMNTPSSPKKTNGVVKVAKVTNNQKYKKGGMVKKCKYGC